MDVQVEHLEGHVAQLTVTVDKEKTQEAKQKAARHLARNVRVPGFRPGKAPYAVIVSRLGEAAILEEALENLGQELYREALDQSEITPAAPGEIHKVAEHEGQLQVIFTVPKGVEVDLKEYRSVRADLEVKEVTDEEVKQAMEDIRESRAVIEDVDRPAKVGDEVEMELEVTWWHTEDHDHDHGEEDEDDSEEEAEASAEDEDVEEDDDDDDDYDYDEHEHGHEHTLIDDEKAKVVLRPDGHERDLFPGFSAQVVGMSKGEEKEFEITLPDDYPDASLAGQTIEVEVEVLQVRSRTLPELNDTFAASTTEGKFPTLLELRMDVRKQLQENAQAEAEDVTFDAAMQKIIEGAEIRYHPATVEAYLDDMLERIDQKLRQQANVPLADYLRLSNQTRASFRDSQREKAIESIKRDFVMLEIVRAEKLSVDDAAVTAEIDRLASQFGEQAARFRQILDTPSGRTEIGSRQLNEKMVKRVVAIATGQNPAIEEPAEPEAVAEEA